MLIIPYMTMIYEGLMKVVRGQVGLFIWATYSVSLYYNISKKFRLSGAQPRRTFALSNWVHLSGSEGGRCVRGYRPLTPTDQLSRAAAAGRSESDKPSTDQPVHTGVRRSYPPWHTST